MVFWEVKYPWFSWLGREPQNIFSSKFSNHACPHTWLCAVRGTDLENLHRNRDYSLLNSVCYY